MKKVSQSTLSRNHHPKEMRMISADSSLQTVLDNFDFPFFLQQPLLRGLSWQERNQISVRQALSTPRIVPQWLVGLLACGSMLSIERQSATNTIPLEVYIEDRARTKIVAIYIPHANLKQRYGEAHVSLTPSSKPIIAVVAMLDLEGSNVRKARIAFAGIWQEPVRMAKAASLLEGYPINTDQIHIVSEGIIKEAAPRSNFLGSEDYRRNMAGVLARRAIEGCMHQEVIGNA